MESAEQVLTPLENCNKQKAQSSQESDTRQVTRLKPARHIEKSADPHTIVASQHTLHMPPLPYLQVAGLKSITVKSANQILTLLEDGNKRRKTESTDANSQSSRSHAVLEITIKRTPRNHYRVQQLKAKLSLVSLPCGNYSLLCNGHAETTPYLLCNGHAEITPYYGAMAMQKPLPIVQWPCRNYSLL